MNTSNITFAKITFTLPKPLIEYLRNNIENMSKYVSETVSERVIQEEREKAFKEIFAGPPSFTEIEDSTTYVRMLRDIDKERDKRLGLL